MALTQRLPAPAARHSAACPSFRQATPAFKRPPVWCNAAAGSGAGALQFAGTGKVGTTLFNAPSPTVAPAPGAASPGVGTLDFAGGAGKSGCISFNGSPAAASNPKTLKEKLAAAGLAGLVSYGLLNTLYYSVAFVLALKVANISSGLGVAAAAGAVAKLLAIVWAGSQVTKAPRAFAALLAAPAVDRLLAFVNDSFKLTSKRDAFLRVILPGCLLFAAALFGFTTLLLM